ncbi:MAG: (cytosine-5)-methyltransferase 1 [Fimbriimonadaceae bacterium]|nr:(cytosine-5)-methyltransferase 1 [Fimbriimonadaceae bacterium]
MCAHGRTEPAISEVSLSAVDVFSGCGGASRGFIQAGFNILAAIEIDKTAALSYGTNFPTVPVLQEDISAVDLSMLETRTSVRPGEVDVVIGCPPCQGFSAHRLNSSGANDPRNRLVQVFADLILQVRPTAFVFENVPGMLRHGGSVWPSFVEKVTAAGYTIRSAVLDAANYGAPQHRKRFTAFGSLHGVIELPEPSHGRSIGIPWVSVREAFSGLQRLPPGACCVADRLHASPVHTNRVVKLITAIPANGGSRRNIPSDYILPCHRTHDGHRDVYGRLAWDKPSGTITGGCTQPSKGRFSHPEDHRGLTLREAARLQGFPDDHSFCGAKQDIALQIGNSVPPPFAFALAKHLAVEIHGCLNLVHHRAKNE